MSLDTQTLQGEGLPVIEAKPLGLFILFSRTAEQDPRKGKIEGEARGAKTTRKFPKCSESQKASQKTSPVRISALLGVRTLVLTHSLPF